MNRLKFECGGEGGGGGGERHCTFKIYHLRATCKTYKFSESITIIHILHSYIM